MSAQANMHKYAHARTRTRTRTHAHTHARVRAHTHTHHHTHTHTHTITRAAVAKEFKEYSASYGAEGTGTGITDRERTVQLVDVFYSLVTDIYEW